MPLEKETGKLPGSATDAAAANFDDEPSGRATGVPAGIVTIVLSGVPAGIVTIVLSGSVSGVPAESDTVELSGRKAVTVFERIARVVSGNTFKGSGCPFAGGGNGR